MRQARTVAGRPVRPLVHVVRTAEMERATGVLLPPQTPVVVDYADEYPLPDPPLRGLCDAVVADRDGVRAEAASVRALRRDPRRFDGEHMCTPCLAAALNPEVT